MATPIKPKRFSKYGRLTVICVADEKRWLCQCECGTVRQVRRMGIILGNSRSCGCLSKEFLSRLRTTSKPISIEIAKIVNQYDVRRALNDERVLSLAELIEGGVELPPIQVIMGDDGWIFVDGRHRAAAHTLLDKKEIVAVVVDKQESAKMFSQSLLANWGGALPPTTNDIRHTVRRMMEAGATATTVLKELSFLPASQLKKYIDDSRSQMKKIKIRMALDSIADGLRPNEAAAKFDVDLESVKAAISGIKKKFGSGDVGIESENKVYVKTVMKSATVGITKRLENLFHYVDAGEIRSVTVTKIIDEWEGTVLLR